MDTNVIIWYFDKDFGLKSKIEELIKDPTNEIYISHVSIWEMVIKINANKLSLKSGFDSMLDDIFKSKFEVLQTKNSHLKKYLSLPLIHKDPFDRLLISTAQVENLLFITSDDEIHKYDVKWVW